MTSTVEKATEGDIECMSSHRSGHLIHVQLHRVRQSLAGSEKQSLVHPCEAACGGGQAWLASEVNAIGGHTFASDKSVDVLCGATSYAHVVYGDSFAFVGLERVSGVQLGECGRAENLVIGPAGQDSAAQ